MSGAEAKRHGAKVDGCVCDYVSSPEGMNRCPCCEAPAGQPCVDSEAADLARLRALLVEARGILHSVKSAAYSDEYGYACPVCDVHPDRGHETDCSLAALLARLDEEVGK